MKGIIFTELVGFLEDQLGMVRADAILVGADLPNGGAFTSVGNYPTAYALRLLDSAAAATGQSVDTLCAAYGSYLFDRFGILFPEVIQRYGSADELLDHVGSHIHEEMRILYPDARPPRITTTREGSELAIHYESHRPFAHVAYGLIKRSLARFGDTRTLTWESAAKGMRATFRLSVIPPESIVS